MVIGSIPGRVESRPKPSKVDKKDIHPYHSTGEYFFYLDPTMLHSPLILAGLCDHAGPLAERVETIARQLELPPTIHQTLGRGQVAM